MKTSRFSVVIPAVVLLLAVALPVLAQEPPPLPDTAAGALNWLVAALAGLSGVLGFRITERVKLVFPWLRGSDQSKLADIMTDLVALIIAVGTGYLVGALAGVAGWLDTSGIWQVIVWAYPAAWAAWQVDQRR